MLFLNDDLVRDRRKIGTRYAVAVLSLMLSCSLSHAQTAPTPDYVASMADFEVRALTGSYSPTNGMETMQDATPNEWNNNDPGNVGLAGTIIAWSGGAKATTGTKLFVHGGGHNDSANNGLYVFDFSGTTAPAGWSIADISPVSAVRAATSYADGKPAAVHTYDGVVHAQHNNHVYRFAGAIWNPSGGFTSSAWKYNLATNSWTALPQVPGTAGLVSTVYDPVSGKIAVGYGGRTQVMFFRSGQDNWSAPKSTNGAPWAGDVSGAYDVSRRRGVLVGNGVSRLITFDWNNETVQVSNLSASGATELLSATAPSVVYDQLRDSYWIFAGRNGSPGFQNIYEMDAETLVIQRRQLVGDSINVAPGLIGSYGRYVFMPQWRAIGLVARHTSPAYIIKLPAGSGAPISIPMAPTDVAVDP